MNKTATAIKNAVEVVEVQKLPDGDVCIITDCPDYDAYRALPKAVSFDGKNFGLTGWNSDTGRACYKASKKFAVGQ